MSAIEDVITAISTATDKAGELINQLEAAKEATGELTAALSAAVDKAQDAIWSYTESGSRDKISEVEALRGRLEELVTISGGHKDAVEQQQQAVADTKSKTEDESAQAVSIMA